MLGAVNIVLALLRLKLWWRVGEIPTNRAAPNAACYSFADVFRVKWLSGNGERSAPKQLKHIHHV